jgi:hypothetical protein
MKPVPREYIHGLAMVLVFIVLAFIYSVVTPIFEASDEISHYPVVNHIAATGKLPVQQVGVKTLWSKRGASHHFTMGSGPHLRSGLTLETFRALKRGIPMPS